MQRPLLLACLCLVALMAVRHGLGDSPGAGERFPQAGSVTVTGRIYQKNETSFYLNVQSIAAGSRQDNPNLSQRKMKIICAYDMAESLQLGDTVVLEGISRPFSAATNPGEFDYADYYRSLGIAGRVERVEILEYGGTCSPVPEALHRLRAFWKRRLYSVFPEKEASIMTAVLLGDKGDLDSDVKALYQKNGIIHILSISGLHITLIGLGLYRLLRRLGMPVWSAAVCGGVTLALYGMMTGLSVSACRAIGMYLLRMLALLCGRTYDMLTALGVMAVLLVWENPGYVEHMGFLLSFGSVLGVGALCPALTPGKDERKARKRRYVEGRWKQALWRAGKRLGEGAAQGLLAGASITLTTLPVQLWFSYEVPVYAALLNMLILPFMGALAAAGLAAMLAPGLGAVGTLDILILAGYEKLCVLFDSLPFHTWNPGRPKVWQVALYYALWLLVTLGTGWHRRMRKKGVLPGGRALLMAVGKAAALAAAVLVLGLRLPEGDRVTFLDVGQGDGICVQLSTGEVYLFDCGSSSRGRVGERALIPFLKYHGVSHVDGVFLSHPDSDHMNGLVELLALCGEERIRIDQVVLPGIAPEGRREAFGEFLEAVEAASAKKEIGVSFVQAGDSLWGQDESGRRFLCLHPAAGFPAKEANAYSACFYMELEGGCSLLLTGDVEGDGEAALLEAMRRQGIAGATVLKVAHHGSRYTTAGELLEKVSPDLAVISCGRNNRYGHPHAETLERLEAAGAWVARTDQNGAVTLHAEKDQAWLETFLNMADR